MYGDAPRRSDPDVVVAGPPDYPEKEVNEIMDAFTEMLWMATGDGREKRKRGEKPNWKVDPDHERALFSHLYKWKRGDTHDSDSGAHPLVHLAWRALAIAYQENHADVEEEVHISSADMVRMAAEDLERRLKSEEPRYPGLR